MTLEEKEAIKTMEGSVGFRAMQHMMARKIQELDSVSSLDGTIESVAVEALGKKYAVETLKTFLTDITFYTGKESITNKTYE